MNTRSRISLIVFVVAASTVLAGCSGVLGTGPSIEDTSIQVSESNGAELAVNYSVNDYATVIVENPSGEVVNSKRVSSERSRAVVSLGEPQGGIYTIAIQQGGETKTETTVEYAGPNPAIKNVNTTWSGTTLSRVNVTIENTGDLPVRIQNSSVTAREQTSTTGIMYRWLPAGETGTISIGTQYGSSIDVTKAGDVRGQVVLQTSAGELTSGFTDTFEGPKVEIVETNPQWNKNMLTSVDVRVRNAGDMPTEANASIEYAGEQLATDRSQRIAPGETARYSLSSAWGDLYEVSSGGNVSFTVISDGSRTHDTATINRRVESASLTISSFQTNWESGRLKSARVSVQNKGAVDADYTTRITVNGEEVWSSEESVSGGSSSTLTAESGLWSDALYVPSGGGTYNVTATVVGPGGTHVASQTKEFEDPEISVQNVDTMFIKSYNSNKTDFSSVNFDVQNTGNIPIQYDSVRVSLDGVERSDNLYSTQVLDPGESSFETVSTTDYISVDPGTYQLRIEFTLEGETVSSDTVTISTDSE